MKGDNGRLQYLRFCLFEMYVSVVFVIRCVYSTVSLTLVREQHFIAVIYYYYYYFLQCPLVSDIVCLLCFAACCTPDIISVSVLTVVHVYFT